METVYQEIEAFSQSISIVETHDDVKRTQIISRLKSKVTIEQGTFVLAEASKNGDEDLRRATEKALSVLLDTVPSSDLIQILKLGFEQPDPKLRVSSIRKVLTLDNLPNDIVSQITMRLKDSDVAVFTTATEFVKNNILKYETIIFQVIDSMLLSNKKENKSIDIDSGTFALRIWELGSQILNLPDMTPQIQSKCERIVNSMFQSLEKWNDDVLYVLNELEIMVSLPRTIVAKNGHNLIPILLRYVNEQELIADDSLRLLGVLHYDLDKVSGSIDSFLNAIDLRMSNNHFSLASLEVLGNFVGANSKCFNYMLEKRPKSIETWLSCVMKMGYAGNDLPRNVALDAISRSLRGGSLLKYAFSLSTEPKDGEKEELETQLSAACAWKLYKPVLPDLFKALVAAIQSLHPQIQIAAYHVIRMIVSQNSRWGIIQTFENIPNQHLLDVKMPSPNTNRDAREARYAAVAGSAIRYLSPQEDTHLLRSIQTTMIRPITLSETLAPATVDVATQRY